MKINLIPISSQILATIEIDASEFIIGRMEEPFVSVPKEMTNYISRQHAKIFCIDEHFCIVDLGSQNGTKVNGNILGEHPRVLNQNDEIEVSKNFKFKVEIINPQLDETVLIPKQNNELMLEPVDRDSGLDNLVITGFPFLISKEAGIFSSFQSTFADEMSQISRRHAFISIEQENFIVTDMGSTNGSFVNNDRIGKQGKVLQTGDVISFGGDFFSYIVKLTLSNQSHIEDDATCLSPVAASGPVDKKVLITKEINAENNASVIGKINELRTTFVNDPSSFLDIFCDGGSINKNNDSESAQEGSSERATVILGKKTTKNKCYFIVLLIILLLLISGGAFYYFYNQSIDVEELINQGNYTKAADQSMQLLAQTPENEKLLTLSTKAILNSIVPEWQIDLTDNDFPQAEKRVKTAQEKYADNPDIGKTLPIMQWINRLFRFMSTRNENTKVVMFQDEHLLNNLLEAWNQNKKQNELTLALIVRNVPAFKATYKQILSFIRTLEHDQDIYIKAINTLKSTIRNKLQANRSDELMADVTQFEKKYRVISGTENLKLDIKRYVELEGALKSKDIDLINKVQHQMDFSTPLFKQFAEQTLTEKFPSQDFTTQYHNAVQFWQTGDIESAINNLSALSGDNWGSAALNKLKRYQLVVDKYNTLNKSRNTNKYIENLFNFHALLQLPEDNYFLNAIESDFQENKNQAVIKIQNHAASAQFSWQKYLNKGGIGGLLRLENQISNRYQSQAVLLSKAHYDISYAKRLYTELQIPEKVQWKQIYSAISEEMDKQKKWLMDLELILKPSVLKQKLNLLNIPEGRLQ